MAEQQKEIVKDDVHTSLIAEDELAAITVSSEVFFWLKTEDFCIGSLQTRGRLIQDV